MTFRERLMQALMDGKLTPNDARRLGMLMDKNTAEWVLDLLERCPPPV